MILARTGDIVTATCICNSVFPYNPYPLTGVIGAGTPQLNSGGLTAALGQLTLVNFICTSGPQTALIMGTSMNSTGAMQWARLTDTAMGACITGGVITSAAATIDSM